MKMTKSSQRSLVQIEERVKTKLYFATVLLVLYFSSTCFADPIVIFSSPTFGGSFVPGIGLALVIDCGADLVALLLGYLVIRRVRALVSLRFLPYFGLVVLGGVIIDVVSLFTAGIFFDLLPYGMHVLGGFIFVGLFFYLYNGFLSKKFFNLEDNQARVIGVVMGILTNPLVGRLVTDGQVWQ
jgi:hypothetical protein